MLVTTIDNAYQLEQLFREWEEKNILATKDLMPFMTI